MDEEDGKVTEVLKQDRDEKKANGGDKEKKKDDDDVDA